MSDLSSACQKLIPLLDAYHDGELDGGERQEVEQHLPGCESCRVRLSEIESITGSLRSLPRVRLKRDFADDIDQLLGSSQRTETPAAGPVSITARPRSRVIWGSIAIAAAIALILIAGRFMTGGPVQVLAKKQKAAPSQADRNADATDTQEIASDDGEGIEPAPSPLDQKLAKSTGHAQKSPVYDVVGHSAPAMAHKAEADSRVKSAVEQKSTQSDRQIAIAPPIIGQHQKTLAVESVSAGTATPDVIALYDAADTPCTDELGLSTDEDGLYALKL